ncbi:MAG: hypothetical protein ACE37F_10195 [Nannocystaceae bacterium]|nr:hypothetical protein [bacterium]
MRWAGLSMVLVLGGCVERLIEGEPGAGGQSEGAEATGRGSTSEEGSEDTGVAEPPASPVEQDLIYVNSPDTLLTFDPQARVLSPVGPFVLEDGSAASVTDIAVDRFGLLYAVSVGTLYVCDPNTVVCTPQGSSSANSAGFAEFGALADDHDVLVLVEGSSIVHVHVREDGIETVVAGSLDGYSSSGDVIELSGRDMLLSSPSPDGGDVLVPFDALTGAVVGQPVPMPPLSYGLARFRGEIWVFTDLGEIFVHDGAETIEVGRADVRLWGAAVHPSARWSP